MLTDYRLIFFVILAVVFIHSLYRQFAALRKKEPPYDRTIWVMLVYDVGIGLFLTGVLASLLDQNQYRWQEQLMFGGVGILGIAAESEVFASLLGQPVSKGMSHWGVRIGVSALGILFMYLGFGKAAGLI